MSQNKRTVWDDIVELGREVLDKLDEAMNPNKHRKPARVPVPVRTNYPTRRPDDDPYQ